MANENAARDDNGRLGLLVHSADGTETRQAKQGPNGGLLIEQVGDEASNGTPTVTGLNASDTSIELLAANATRDIAKFYNASDKDMYLLEGDDDAAIASGGYTIVIMPDGLYETRVKSAIQAIWPADVTGYVNITEVA